MRRSEYDEMNLKALRCFYVMAQRQSVSQASIELGVSEAAVSQRIKLLEGYLGSKLYSSRGGRVKLTMQGEHTFSFAMSLFDEIDEFESELKKEPQSGEIILAAHDSILRYMMPDKVKAFLNNSPKTRFSLLSRPVEEILRLVRSNEIDIGVVAQCRVPKELHFRFIAAFPAYLIFPKGDALADVSQKNTELLNIENLLAKRSLICLERKQEGRRLIDSIEQHCGLSHIQLEVGTIESLKQYVALGLGFSVISALSLTARDKAKIDFLQLPKSFDADTIYGVVTRRDKRENATVERFVEVLLDRSV
ncbi:LysR family transcriptional regulator [Vibrio ouci]|uniref:LysR family transcriptional regulator n=1 Tax=Vibrio ouci TaxID=2499078 RepID=A0A4Y8W957_9VIBR|nr:LysR family transcriptional regulator [Vibrio ouci]TFH89334.1 LysR family transcriptional regulator [Vibrio ouci]